MTVYKSDALREDMMDAINALLGANAEVQVRSGVNADTGGQGTLLAQLTGNAAGWGVSSAGVLTSNAITADSSADATGVAGHYQLNTSGGVFVESGLIDGSDGVSIDNVNITLAQVVQMDGNWVKTAAG